MKTTILVIASVICMAVAFYYLWRIFKLRKLSPRFNATLLQLLVWGTILEFFMLVNAVAEVITCLWVNLGVVVMMWFVFMASKHRKGKKYSKK